MTEVQFLWKWVTEKFKQIEKEKVLQAEKYETRLNDLNHEAARILSSQEKSISVEKHEGDKAQMWGEINNMQKEIKLLSEYKTKQEGSSKVILYLLGAAIAIIVGIAIKLFTSKI